MENNIQYNNNSTRLKDEFQVLNSNNPELKKLIEDLASFCNITFKKSIMITMIYRTQEEQDMLYQYSKKYQERKFKSPHQFWHSIDLRSTTFDKNEIIQIEAYINDNYNK